MKSLPILLLVVCSTAGADEAARQLATDSMITWQRTVQINRAVRNWLDCTECMDHELDILVTIGEPAIPSLSEARSVAQDALNQQDFQHATAFNAFLFAKYQADRFDNFENDLSERKSQLTKEDFVRSSVVKLLRQYRDRARVAIETIEASGNGGHR